ncbi:acyl-CoA dehydrogenase family protein [Actinosynnema sp. NPDC020468]|uniref:acyl-CoA dehydrogenase family protein n=1 Tax=Actinosynnema sp. NPDC020468 TaxID=3154488 RepID=UPI0033ECAD41
MTFRAEVRSFVAGHAPAWRPGARGPADEREAAAWREWTAALFARGYVGADWPVDHGGTPGHQPERDAVVAQELAAAQAPRPGGAGIVAAGALLEFGTEAQCRRYLPAIRSGADLWCVLFSEPEAGSDLAALRTSAVPDGAGYRVTGHKVWTTNGQWADRGLLLARTGSGRHDGLSAFVVDLRAPGVRAVALRTVTGEPDFAEVHLDGAPAEPLGGVGRGWAVATAVLVRERALFAAAPVLRVLWERLRARVGDDPGTHGELGRLRAEVVALGALEEEPTADPAAVKLRAGELRVRLAACALDLAGPAGLDDEELVVGYLDSHAYTLGGGTSEILRTVIARRGLGLPG